MSPEARRDLLIGAPVVLVGALLLCFAFFGDDEGFRSPRWVVGLIALACIAAGAIPLGGLLARGERPTTRLGAGVASAIFAAIALATAWAMVAIGPEGTAITFDVPLPLSQEAGRTFRAILFYGLAGSVSLLALALAVVLWRTAQPKPGRTTVVAIVAILAGLAGWIAIERGREAAAPRAPVVHLTFDQRFPADSYPATVIGREVAAAPGRKGQGLFLGGGGDFIDVDIPGGNDTARGLSIELWMNRDDWLNPYLKGSRTQTMAVVELERERRGRPEVVQAMLYLQVSAPPGESADAARDPGSHAFRPRARVGDLELAAPRAFTVAARRWVHVALVYDRFLVDRVRLYLDGRVVARTAPFASGLGYADLRTMRIGTWSERNGAFRGVVDEVKVYARALTDEEIAADAAFDGK